MTSDKSLIQGAELWVPSGDTLTLRSGAYGPHTEFARVSAKSRFRRGEGMPGAVWVTQQALVWNDLSTHFVRAEHAAAAGIDAVIGLPWFYGRELAGVVTLLLTASTASPSCVELWNHDDTLDVLRHGGGLYAKASGFAELSKLLQFPYAAGLPGLTWSRGIPTIVEDVGASNEFVRAEIARKAGFKLAIGVPFYRDRRVAHVLALIASGANGFIRACQLFGHGERGLVSRATITEAPSPGRASPSDNALLRASLAREVWLSPRLPLITPTQRRDRESPEDSAASEILLTLPIHDGIRLRGVACFEF